MFKKEIFFFALKDLFVFDPFLGYGLTDSLTTLIKLTYSPFNHQ